MKGYIVEVTDTGGSQFLGGYLLYVKSLRRKKLDCSLNSLADTCRLVIADKEYRKYASQFLGGYLIGQTVDPVLYYYASQFLGGYLRASAAGRFKLGRLLSIPWRILGRLKRL